MNKILITTMLKFVLWDGSEAHVLHEGDLSLGTAHYDGITWDEDNIFVSATIDTKYLIRLFSKSFEPVGILDDGDLHETHQIFWLDGKLYCTNTGLNRIEVWDGKEWADYAWIRSTCDIDHINGIWSDGDRLYVSEFGNRGEAKKPSAIKTFDKEFRMLSDVAIGRGIHNVYLENDCLYTFQSWIPRIVRYSLQDNSMSFFNLNNVKDGLIRGLARTKDYWYVGVSRWETERDKRHVGDAVVLRLDNKFEEIDRIILPDFGPVCDIRVIDELDLAHNGIEF